MLYIFYLNIYFIMFIILTHKVNKDLYSKVNDMSLLPDIHIFSVTHIKMREQFFFCDKWTSPKLYFLINTYKAEIFLYKP